MSTAEWIETPAGLRERLLHVALRLFADHGVDGVSMRSINLAAGSKNKSAVQYHFGSKLGILEALFDELKTDLSPIYDKLHRRLEELDKSGALTVAEIVISSYLPLMVVQNRAKYSRALSKLLAKMLVDSTPEYQQLFIGLMQPQAERTYHLLKKLIPEKSEQDLKFQVSHGMMATITGIATIDLLDNTLLGDIRYGSEEQMLFAYIDYMVGGLTHKMSIAEDIDLQFWMAFAGRELSGFKNE